MGFLKVDTNTNPIPASILTPKAFGFPSGGGGGGGGPVTIIKIAPVGPALADGIQFVGGSYPWGSHDLATVNLNLLGGKKLLVIGNFQIRFTPSPGTGAVLSGDYSLSAILGGVPFGAVTYGTEGAFGFFALGDSGAAGNSAVGIRLVNNNLKWTLGASEVPVDILPIVGNVSALEFDEIP